MTTLNKISEQIKLFYGHSQTGEGPHIEELKLLAAQVLNRLFKMEKVGEISAIGDFNPSATLIATYDDQPVEEWKDRSRVKLPVYPISMPMGMGVWYVAPSDDIDNFFVPLISGQAGLIKSVSILNNYENRVAYEVQGDYVVFTKNLLDRDTPITSVLIRELVVDVTDLDEYDPLTIPPDMEEPVIEEVLKLLGVRKPTETVNNPKDHG